ncbi:von Willebrand factor type A domain containing protein [Acanthamoeba castellanii str. Neff]|uniref:von Willebrand factor type A domain containing protein n=1 Tax=Acanthamoeba castellanii (strain ATCC 30010 / Neff) TaxID=1257118 RepID=L8GH56_ACACF|nr:von Willebrand factor type A domain containing protein [Acanthamoeba castellanii str. Neff]ELR11526.1 von Willebrand factor type A domain containing protein [Acanthamoeba castellanii str. Neff]
MCYLPGYLWWLRAYYTPEKPQAPIPLKDVRVEALIADFVVSVTIHQTFINVEEQPIEAVYMFPLEEKAAVTNFVACIDGKKIRGVIQEKEEARATYEDAIASGHGAYKLEEKDDEANVFTVNVGNLPPGKEVTISITYATELTFVEGLLQWRLPSTNDNPSYFVPKEKSFAVPELKLTVKLEMTSNIRTVSSPSHPITFEFGDEPTQGVVTMQPSPAGTPPVDFLQWRLPSTNDNPSYFVPKEKSFAVPELKLTVKLEMTSNIRTVSSPSHPITFEFGDEPTQGVVTMQPSPAGTPPVDFVLLTKLATPHQPGTRVGVNEKGNKAIMLSLYPNLELSDDDDVYTEMVFLVDRSYSMAGQRIAQVKETLAIFLRSLGPGTFFNIIGFGSRTQHLFKNGSVEYNDTNLEIAAKHVALMNADLDGTDILKPLKEVLQTKPKDGYPRQLFILTDGQVANTIECVEFVRKHADTTRVFTFGIGSEASTELVKGLARAGEGFYEFVHGNDSMEEKVMRQLNRAMQPALTNLALTWKGFKVRQSPHRLSPLFAGGRIVVYAFPQDGEPQTGQIEVTLRAKIGNKPFISNTKIDLNDARPGDLIHKLAAKSTLRDLAECRSYFHNPKGEVVPGKNVTQEAVRLSVEHGVMSKLTAFVAVEEREEITEGSMQLRKVPITFEKMTDYIAKRNRQLAAQKCHEEQKRHRALRDLTDRPQPGPPQMRGSCAPIMASSASSLPMMSALSYDSSGSDDEYANGGGGAPAAPMARAFGKSGGCGRGGGVSKDKVMLKKNKKASSTAAPMRSRKSLVSSPPRGEGAPGGSGSFIADERCKEEAEAEAYAGGEDEEEATEADAGSTSTLVQPQPQQTAPEEPTLAPAPALMRSIITRQKASGSWEASDVADLLQIPLDQLLAALPATAASASAPAAVLVLWATAVASAYLLARFADQKVNWELVVRKAHKFVARQAKTVGGGPAAVIDWHQLAADFLASLP